MSDNRNDELDNIMKHIILHSPFLEKLGLFYGKFGVLIAFYHYARYFNPLYEEIADNLLEDILSHLSSNVGIGFADGLCGIGWGICYLLENHYLEGEADEILQEIDAKVLEYEPLRMIDLSVETGLAGIAVYLAKRKSFIDSFSSNPYFNDYLLALEVRLKNYKNRHILDFMKKLNAIRLSEAKELTPNEQKQLWGGTDGLILACHCTCHDVSAGLSDTDAVWMTYTSSGSCSATSVYNIL